MSVCICVCACWCLHVCVCVCLYGQLVVTQGFIQLMFVNKLHTDELRLDVIDKTLSHDYHFSITSPQQWLGEQVRSCGSVTEF